MRTLDEETLHIEVGTDISVPELSNHEMLAIHLQKMKRISAKAHQLIITIGFRSNCMLALRNYFRFARIVIFKAKLQIQGIRNSTAVQSASN